MVGDLGSSLAVGNRPYLLSHGPFYRADRRSLMHCEKLVLPCHQSDPIKYKVEAIMSFMTSLIEFMLLVT